jgi:hypothetical protein
MSKPAKRPLRYRGIDLRPEREHPRAGLVGAVVLALLALSTLSAVVRGMILATERSRLDHVSWTVFALTCLLAFALGRAALRLWRGAKRAETRPPASA